MREIFIKNFAVKGANFRDIERGGFFQKGLSLRAVLSDDSDIISSRFVVPGFVRIYRTRLPKIKFYPYRRKRP